MLTDNNKLWVKIYKDKYLRKTNFMDCIPGSHQSPMWRDILRGRSLLTKGLKVGKGNGESTSLWYHHWIGDAPLYKLAIKDIPDRISHWFVRDIIDNGRWNINRIKQFLPSHICNLIKKNTPISKGNTTKDYIRWIHTRNGAFSIKSAYSLSFNNGSYTPSPSSCFHWKSIWKVKVPFKYKMFIWNCCNEILPVAQKHSSVIHEISPTFVRCYYAVETHLHLFRDCWESSIIWNYIFQRLSIASSINLQLFFNSDWTHWIYYNLN